ncbi:MAG: HTH domain-containing protein [Ruminococcaceae bacterium]|nr:HTH domain-containing protein [Oscillospiraceae bacterium]
MPERFIAKKAIILYVLNVIKVYASADYPVSQTAICHYLNDIHIFCDRKTVGRNIKYLQEFGYPICKVNNRGYYLDTAKMATAKNKLIV